MIAIMRDGMGVGLAATQLGVLRRLLVFQAGPDGEPTALVNPEIEWLSDEVVARRGGLPQPAAGLDGRRAPAARPGQRPRRRGRADRDRGLGPRGARPPARDRPPRRRPDPRPHRAATSARAPCGRCARAAATARRAEHEAERRGRASRAAHRRVRTVYLGTSDFAATVLRRLAALAAPPGARRHPARPPPGPRPQAAAAAGRRRGRRSWGSSCCRPRTSTTRRRWSGSAPPSREAVVVCAFGQLIREPLLSELQMLNVHPSLLPRWRGAAPIERAIMAGDERTGVCVMRLDAGLDSGPVALRAEVRARRRRGLRGALRDAWPSSAASCWSGRSTCAAEGELEFAEQDEAAVDLRGEDRPGRAPPRPGPARPPSWRATVRALTPHVGAYLETADGERLGVRRARAVDVSVEHRRARGRVRARCWSAAGDGALRLEVVQPPGGKPMPADAYLRGHALPKLVSGVIAPARRARLRDDPRDLRGRRLHRARLPRRRRAPRPRRPRARPGAAARLRRRAAPRHHRRRDRTARRPLDPAARPAGAGRAAARPLRAALRRRHPRPRRRRPGGRAGQGRRRRPRRRPRQRGPAPGGPRARRS